MESEETLRQTDEETNKILQAMAHDALNIGHDLKADVKILTAEVWAWAADVVNLQEKAI